MSTVITARSAINSADMSFSASLSILLLPFGLFAAWKLKHTKSGVFNSATRKDLRPQDWHLIWPELVESQASAGAVPRHSMKEVTDV